MKKKIIALFLTLLNVVPVFAEVPAFGQCDGFQFPTDICTSGYYCAYVNEYYSQCLPSSGTAGPLSFALIAPPGYARLDWGGNQSISVTATNQNMFLSLMTIQPKYYGSWSFGLLPFASTGRKFDVFTQTPVSWYLVATTNADAAYVSISIK
jgi:hypothetical protein